nr:ATP synthase F0 subunit 8 [Membranacea stenoprocessa]
MPQLAPIWWFFLMNLFIFTLILMICYIYFYKNFSVFFTSKFKIQSMIWSW